ncbi:hypothetical protein [Anaerobacterium chartisolvens]|nr:hypothetical protein [Anaerobacterium chartisolvens]
MYNYKHRISNGILKKAIYCLASTAPLIAIEPDIGSMTGVLDSAIHKLAG